MDLRPLSDDALLNRLELLVTREREAVADIVEHLLEAERREIVVDRGYSSLFDYCVKKLKYPEPAAYLRIRAVRAAREFPRVLADLRSGALHLDAVMRLYPHLREENSDRLLDLAAGATKREVVALVATLPTLGPPAPKRDVIRLLPSPRSASVPPAEVIPPPDSARVSFNADDETLALIKRLKDLHSHRFPSGDLNDLLKVAVGAYLARVDPCRKAHRPPRVEARKRSRRIPQWIKNIVAKRDGGRCAFIAEDGRRCESTRFPEFDHIVPWALGGRSDDPANVRQLCRTHNQRLAKRRFGPRRKP